MSVFKSLLDHLRPEDKNPAGKIRIVVAGCRDYYDYCEAAEFIDMIILQIAEGRTPVIISGGCRGADALGERYAREHGYKVERFEADWDKYGRSAGPIRNRQMAEHADAVICFWDGVSRGTSNMLDEAHAHGLRAFVKKIVI